MYKVYHKTEGIDPEDYPDIVYKYRIWNLNEPENRIITHRELYLNSPTGLMADYPECRLPMCWELMTEEYIKKWLKLYIYNNPEMDELLRSKLINDDYSKNIVNFSQRGWQLECEQTIYDQRDQILGVFCASDTKTNLHLWESFAGLSTGYCVGLKTAVLLDAGNIGMIGKVNYYKPGEEPINSPLCLNNQQRIYEALDEIYNVPAIYTAEREYRMVKTNIVTPTSADAYTEDTRRILLPEDAYAEIILGSKMNEKDEDELRKALQNVLPNVPVFKTQ